MSAKDEKKYRTSMYSKLREHIGHEIECVGYGRDKEPPENVALECLDCCTVLTDFNHPNRGEWTMTKTKVELRSRLAADWLVID